MFLKRFLKKLFATTEVRKSIKVISRQPKKVKVLIVSFKKNTIIDYNVYFELSDLIIKFTEQVGYNIIIDLTNVRDIEFVILFCISEVAKDYRKNGGDVKLIQPQAQKLRMDIKSYNIINVYENKTDAMKSFIE